VKISYDPVADAAYIYLRDDSSTFSQMIALDPQVSGGMINLDYDTDGFLRGIEILGASRLLRPEYLRQETPSEKKQ
jgi:uncharacterized protein YuzE